MTTGYVSKNTIYKFILKLLTIRSKHKKNAFEFGQFPHEDQVKYYLKINGETEFIESINEDWLEKMMHLNNINVVII